MTSDILDRLAESLLQLTPTTCRWPIGDPQEHGFRFCLAYHAPGSSYCPEHHAVAVGKAQGRLNMPQE
jgi:GcrA cell cycle regulator